MSKILFDKLTKLPNESSRQIILAMDDHGQMMTKMAMENQYPVTHFLIYRIVST